MLELLKRNTLLQMSKPDAPLESEHVQDYSVFVLNLGVIIIVSPKISTTSSHCDSRGSTVSVQGPHSTADIPPPHAVCEA